MPPTPTTQLLFVHQSLTAKRPTLLFLAFGKYLEQPKSSQYKVLTLRRIKLLTGYLGHPLQSVLAEELTLGWKNSRFVKGSDDNVSEILCGRFLFTQGHVIRSAVKLATGSLPIIKREEQTYPILKDVAPANTAELSFHPILRLVFCCLTSNIPEARDRDLCGQAEIASKRFLLGGKRY